MKPQKSKLYYMKYQLADEPKKFLEIATTRPETLMGDTGVAVNPNDERYGDLIGQKVIRPFPYAEIPIVADDHIDPEFGTGVLKVTPAHDKADFEIGLKHDLEIIDVFNPDGTLNEHAGEEFEGMDRFVAREKAAEKLDEMGLLVKVEDYENNVGFSERADVPVEPRISMQWFLKYPCVEEATAAVANDEITFRPGRWKKTFAHWMEGIQDWCISRQLWWGHRIPVWYRAEKAEELQAAESLDAESAGADLHVGVDPPEGGEDGWVQDGDVLDTWFSSWLWPFATMTNSEGEDSETLKKFYPTTDLVTGPDIIFFWVARMIMAGYRFEGQLPFKNVFFTSIIRDKDGRKLSKQLGNSPDPLDLMANYGADALRFSIMRIAPLGTDLRFIEKTDKKAGTKSYPQVEEGRNFATKLWNACRFRQMQGDVSPDEDGGAELSIYAVDILARLDDLQKNLVSAYAEYRFSELAQLLYEFFWNNYCDRFLEAAKADFGDDVDPAARAVTLRTIDRVIERFLMLLHPYMPHITEELWETFGFGEEGSFLMNTAVPATAVTVDAGLDAAAVKVGRKRAAQLYEAVGRARNLKAEYGLGARKDVVLIVDPAEGADWIGDETRIFALLAGAGEICIEAGHAAEQGVPTALTDIGKIYLPLEGMVDVEAETARLTKERDKAAGELKKVNSKLANENFVSRAPDEVVEENRQRQADWKARVDELETMLANLAG